jgi:hypothetical protein
VHRTRRRSCANDRTQGWTQARSSVAVGRNRVSRGGRCRAPSHSASIPVGSRPHRRRTVRASAAGVLSGAIATPNNSDAHSRPCRCPDLPRYPHCTCVASQTHSSAVVGELVDGLLSGGTSAAASGRSVSDWLHAPTLQGDAAPRALLVFISKQVDIPRSPPPAAALASCAFASHHPLQVRTATVLSWSSTCGALMPCLCMTMLTTYVTHDAAAGGAPVSRRRRRAGRPQGRSERRGLLADTAPRVGEGASLPSQRSPNWQAQNTLKSTNYSDGS